MGAPAALLWETFRDMLCEDHMDHNPLDPKLAIKLTLLEIDRSLRHQGSCLADHGLQSVKYETTELEGNCSSTVKNQPRSLVDDWPISILSALSKLVEKVVASQLEPFIENILHDNQSGFRRGFSTTSALLNVIDQLYRAKDNKLNSAMVTLDFAQAFDSVDFELLRAKLKRVNIQWLDSGSSHLQFQHPVYQGYVTENSTKPVTVAVVSVVGEELNQHIRFRMANPTPLFHLGLTSGALVTTGVPFDREDKDLFTIYIQAEYEDSDDTKQLIQTLVNISVVDVNDNCPVFMNTPYVVAVSVGSHKHMAFFKVLAIDLDEGENGEVRYELTRGHGELFKVDRKSGEISLKQALQDTQEAYIIIITAYDGGVTPCSTETTLVVKVVAESSPKFERQLYTVTVPESLPPHSLLPVRVVAEAPFDHPVTYAILDNDIRFSIDVTAGALFTEDVLDYETSPLLEIRVRATDSLSGATADTLVTVVLTDVNDCVPTFLESVYNVSLLESTTTGTLIGRIDAFDNDTGVRGVVQYSVAPPPLHGVVSVDSQDGSVYLSQTLDRELNSTFQLVLTATDGGLPKLSSSAILSLHVLDVNDNPPKFERPTYSCRLSAEAVAGQMVTVVHAKDPDIGPLSYLIVAGNEHHTFSINPLTGMISVFNILHLARPEPHVLNVSVTDGVHTRFCKVSINILLTNQHAPVFSANQVEASVGENQPAGTYVTTVIATDQDSGLHGKISYYITTELMRSLFKIDTDTGVMVTAVPLDREHHAMVEVAVVAVDGGGVMVTAVPLDREHHAMVEMAVVAVDGRDRSDIASV
ncbi:fat-like cadherin-related tumor suppressor homolog [Macrosteles quadrilineatus]|uniref:fat-like cadherin-related tumor suppressor homolog n=1 Tax=Macrosteles quadrilineatus TaxID=74068 RepID=UPI0023E33968|nr:fat-like cadherin-related tumor suppressor homolog [Macrosteles quadrilineatus]